MRYSKYLFPFQILLDIVLLESAWYFTMDSFGYPVMGQNVIVSLLGWFVSVYLVNNYRLRRFSRIPKTLQGISKLAFIFMGTNVLFQGAILGDTKGLSFFFVFHLIFFVSLLFARVVFIKTMKRYRSLGRNFRNVIILGETPDTKNLAKNFEEGKELGYRLHGVIPHEDYQFGSFVKLIKLHEINEVFISAAQFGSNQFREIVDFADNNLVKIRVVPNFSGLFANNLKLDYVGFQPILVHREIALDDIVNSTIKRGFDIVFSSLVIVGVLSWLMPILAIIIRCESRGAILFRQKRSGKNNIDFNCFKFRSMTVNNDSDRVQASKNDKRITKMGAFMRKTSIDELPQFFNVFMGDMSVVGPRPHMIQHTNEFANVVDRYMLRHSVKPGITGLAQTMGFRGETKTTQDIKGRITLDRFYIENWNFFLDLKIIFRTVINGAKGEENAY